MLLRCLTASDLHSSLITKSLQSWTLKPASKLSIHAKQTEPQDNAQLPKLRAGSQAKDLVKCSACLSMELWLPDGFKFAFHVNNILLTNRENLQRNVKMLPSNLIQRNRN